MVYVMWLTISHACMHADRILERVMYTIPELGHQIVFSNPLSALANSATGLNEIDIHKLTNRLWQLWWLQ